MQTAEHTVTDSFLTAQGFSKTFPQRFWAKVNKDGPIPQHMPHLGACWVWTAFKRPDGYCELGKGPQGGGNILAHRASWLLHFGATVLCVLHKCDNRQCVRPDHLFAGTHQMNVTDKCAKQRHMHGEGHYRAALTNETVSAMKLMRCSGATFEAVGIKFGVCTSAAFFAIKGRNWKHLA